MKRSRDKPIQRKGAKLLEVPLRFDVALCDLPIGPSSVLAEDGCGFADFVCLSVLAEFDFLPL